MNILEQLIEQTHPYIYISILSAVITFVFGSCLLVGTMPVEPDFKNYRVARRLLGVAYLFIGILTILDLTMLDQTDYFPPTILAATLVIASMQSVFFFFSTVTLIDIHFFSFKRMFIHLGWVVCGAIPFLYLMFHPVVSLNYLLAAAMVAYTGQLIYYTWMFNRHYRLYCDQLSKYFSGDEERRMAWVCRLFYAALIVAFLFNVAIFLSVSMYCYFIVVYTLLFIVFASRYTGYPNIFRNFLPALSTSELPDKHFTSGQTSELEEKINAWVAQKKYVNPDVNLETLSLELGTNQKYLSRHINSGKDQNFRLWICNLRIEEAKRLLVEENDLSITDVGAEVGINNKGTFFRQFLNVTGVTPGTYREMYK